MTLNIKGHPVVFSCSTWSPRSRASVKVTCGKTVLLVTVNSQIKEDNMKLSVHYQERLYAAGLIPGGYFKREAKPSDREVLISRILDRSFRPVVLSSNYEHQVIVTLLSYDPEVDNVDVLASYGIAVALNQGGIQTTGFSFLTRAQQHNGSKDILINLQSAEEAELEVLSSFVNGNLVNIEVESDHAKLVDIVQCLEDSKLHAKSVDHYLNSTFTFAEDKINIDEILSDKSQESILEDLQNISSNDRKRLVDSYLFDNKNANLITEEVIRSLSEDEDISPEEKFKYICGIKNLIRQEFTKYCYQDESNVKRIDGRKIDEIRNIDIEFNPLPATHGSVFFARGLTQCLCSVTIDTDKMAQRIENIKSPQGIQNIMLQYVFPPFAVGEVGRLGAPSRRDIGHGFLARKGIINTLDKNAPTSIRLVCEILSSDGSSSSASACATSLALKHAGVKTTNLVAAISMGLMTKNSNFNAPMGEEFTVITDISGLEDHYGAMDLKVSGGRSGINAIQMDTKLSHGVSLKAIKKGLYAGFEAVNLILDKMESSLSSMTLSGNVKSIIEKTITLKQNDIKFVIGKGGSNIKQITRDNNVTINIDQDSGKTVVVGWSPNDIENALRMIDKSIKPDFKRSDSRRSDSRRPDFKRSDFKRRRDY